MGPDEKYPAPGGIPEYHIRVIFRSCRFGTVKLENSRRIDRVSISFSRVVLENMGEVLFRFISFLKTGAAVFQRFSISFFLAPFSISFHIVSYRSYRFVSFHIVSYRFISFGIVSYRFISFFFGQTRKFRRIF